MALEDNTKKDLANMVRELQAKLLEMKPVESQLTAKLDELKLPAIGLVKDENGNYSLVKIKFDIEKNAAAIEQVENLESKDPAIASHKIKEFAMEKIVRRARGGRYDL